MTLRLKKSFGKSVRHLREAQGMTQAELSLRCKYYQSYISRLERGQANPSLVAIGVIAESLGVTVLGLFETMQEMSRDTR
ncbi:MAG: helix-turn-helix transcriptional regulator [Limnohabitans sp.]|nr:helix-turn-helix transcriptional regulator [Limnohabitans sp.]